MIEPGWYTRVGLGTAHFYKANGFALCRKTEWRPGQMEAPESSVRRCHACDVAYGEAEAANKLAAIMSAPSHADVHLTTTVGDLIKVLRVMGRDWPVYVRGKVPDNTMWVLKPHIRYMGRDDTGEGEPCVVIIPTLVKRV